MGYGVLGAFQEMVLVGVRLHEPVRPAAELESPVIWSEHVAEGLPRRGVTEELVLCHLRPVREGDIDIMFPPGMALQDRVEIFDAAADARKARVALRVPVLDATARGEGDDAAGVPALIELFVAPFASMCPVVLGLGHDGPDAVVETNQKQFAHGFPPKEQWRIYHVCIITHIYMYVNTNLVK